MLECEIKGVIYQKLDFDRFNHKKKLTELEIRNPLIPILRQSVEKYH
jgi:activator of HSP90 ATPase